MIHEIYGETLSYVLETAAGVKVDEDQLLAAATAMAWEGRIEPLLQLLHEKVITKLSNAPTASHSRSGGRCPLDLIGMDERALKALLLAYLSMTDVFLPFSELELGRGYSDLVLVLNRKHRDARYSFLLELKYIKESAPARAPRGQKKPKGAPRAAKPGTALRREVAARFGEAEEQLRRYLGDPRLEGVQGPGGWKAFSVVQVGTRALHFRELGEDGAHEIGGAGG